MDQYDDGEYIDPIDRLNQARIALRAGDAATAQELALVAIPGPEQIADDPELYFQSLHLLADTLVAAGEHADARRIFEEALADSRHMLQEPARSLHQALYHIALADLTIISRSDLSGDAIKDHVYSHTSTALNLLDRVPRPGARHPARFFAYRSIMIASLAENRSGDADFMRMQMDIQVNSASIQPHVADYYANFMAIINAHSDPNAPTVDLAILREVPPLSCYVPTYAGEAY